MAARVESPRRRALWGSGLLLVLRLGMSGVFIVAAIPKIASPDLFAADVFNYQMLPHAVVNALAVGLPWLELVVGICLGVGIWTRASALIMTGMMVMFMIALASATARGLDISCGCFEVGAEGGEGHGALIKAALRDLVFLAATLLLVRFHDAPRPLDLLRRS
jgi:uncharacterized membrane protein YphA (DoxX/SURF4 family)